MAFYFDTTVMLMENRILKKKLLFIHHLETLPANSLAHETYNIQKRFHLPGLVQECRDILLDFGLINVCQYSKWQWKKIINQKIKEKNRCEVLINP